MSDHPYQLRRIVLKDFKSVDEASVDLRPLTIVVGANSAGKSTLLQSILAVTQAVRSRTGATEFPLNGDLVRLGTFEETRNFRSRHASEAPMELAFDLVTSLPQLREEDEPEGQELELLRWHAYIVGPRAASDDVTSGFAQLSQLEIEVSELLSEFDERARTILTCDISSFERDTGLLADVPVVSRRAQLVGGSGTVVAANGRVSDRKDMMSSSVDAVILAGGVPQLLLRREGQFERLAKDWWEIARVVAEEFLAVERRRLGEAGSPAEPSLDAVERARDHLAWFESRLRLSHPDAVRAHFFERLAPLDDEDRRALAVSILQLGENRFRAELRELFGQAEWLDREVLVDHSGAAGEALWRASLVARQFFADSVEYLGPLREAPHVLYDRSPSSTKLGKQGEYTAAVLQSERNTQVVMPMPDGGTDFVPLGYALNFWLQRFGLADGARSEDLARFGISLKVRPVGADRDVDLTAVGVGVSQVLPVLVLCLASPPGSLILLEQPELHLHPKLQSDLADFLLLVARSGRQLVIESHSEHLVNRLRYRIAEDETDETHDLIQLVFAENDDGLTRYRQWGITPFGGMVNDWPDGFLDLTSKEAQNLVRQSLVKRKRAHATADAVEN